MNCEVELPKMSEVRTNEIFTVEESLILKKISKMKSAALKELTEKIFENIKTD